jgi:hypothetical protein
MSQSNSVNNARFFAEYMRLSDMGMVIFFDFTRVRYGSFSGWSGETHFDRKSRDLFYHGGVQAGASYVNGRMIVRPAVTYEQIVKSRIEARDPTSRQYASFKAIDLRTKERIEVSSDPKGLSNYFQKDSTLPLEMSPVFFKAEVLHKYKADPEKYDLHDRSINCRGTWSLETFDINESGQVHTYLRYLAYLPYKEQLYWQSFNEWPKAFLSERAIATDFRGEWYTEYDSLNSVKAKVKRLDEKPPPWWLRRDEDLAKAVHYPATTAPAEWANEVLALDQLLIEGFRAKEFRSLARSRLRGPARRPRAAAPHGRCDARVRACRDAALIAAHRGARRDLAPQPEGRLGASSGHAIGFRREPDVRAERAGSVELFSQFARTGVSFGRGQDGAPGGVA